MLGKISCKIGLHDFERVSEPVPTKGDSEFTFVVDAYALGKCKRCSKLSMVRCWGGLNSYYTHDVKTQAEWLKFYKKDKKLSRNNIIKRFT